MLRLDIKREDVDFDKDEMNKFHPQIKVYDKDGNCLGIKFCVKRRGVFLAFEDSERHFQIERTKKVRKDSW